MNSIIRDRSTGCFVIGPKNITAKINDKFLVKLSTAIAHLIGIPNHDSWQENIMQDLLLSMRIKVTRI